MKKPTSPRLTARQRAELEALAALPDDRIDTTDIPEAKEWTGARRGVFHRDARKRRHARARKTG